MSEDRKISELDAVASNASGDIFPLVQGGTNKRATLSQMQAYMQEYLTLGVTQSGVYLVKVNGEIIRYDDTSDTPIQDAINAAEIGVVSKDSVLLVNYECGPASSGFNGKMEQNIILRDEVNLYAIGNIKIFSNSTDNTPLFTDNGTAVNVFFMGYWSMLRYGGAGVNNRNVIKLTNASSKIYAPDFLTVDSSSGSTNSIDSAGSLNIGMIFSLGGVRITGGTNMIGIDPVSTPNLTVSGGTTYWNGRAGTVTQSGGTVYCNNSQLAIYNISNGTCFVSNSKIISVVISGGSANFNNCIIGEPDSGTVVAANITGGTSRFESCLISGSDNDGLDPGVGVGCSNGTSIISYCTIVMTDVYGGGVTSLAQSSTGVIKNYFSISNTATSGTITVAALTVNANVE